MLATIPKSDIATQASIALIGTFSEVRGTQEGGMRSNSLKLGHKKSY